MRSTNTIVATTKLILVQCVDKFLARDPARKEAVNNPMSADMSDLIMKMHRALSTEVPSW
jgi:hypothetical protein